MKFVQFSPEGATVFFASSQAAFADHYPGYVEIADDDPRVVASEQAHAARVLSDYAGLKLSNATAAGIETNLGTATEPLVVTADTTAEGKSNLLGILQSYALGITTGAYTWYQSGGTLALTQAQLTALAVKVEGYISACYACWQQIAAGIQAGTITSPADVDAAPWPTTERV